MIAIITLFTVFVFVVYRFKNGKNYSQYPPGPFSFPIVGSVLALGSRPHEKLSNMKRKFGNIIAIDFGSVRGIVLNDLATIKSVYSLKELQRRPATESINIVRGIDASGIVFSFGRTNEEQRAFVLKTLKNFGMGKKSIERLLTDELQRLFAALDKQLETPIANKGLFELTVVNSIWTIMTGEHGNPDDSDFLDILKKIRKLSAGFNIFTLFFPHISKLFPNLSGWNDWTKGFPEVDALASKSIHAHKKTFHQDIIPNDLIDSYLLKINNTQDESSSFFEKTGEKNLRSVISDFLAAGTEGVSGSLTWVVTLLIYYPRVQERIHSEIDRILGRNRFPSLEDRQNLPYTESVIFEMLRFSALAPFGIPRATSEDVKIEQFIIPKGIVVMANLYDALHDQERWNEPEKFKPERFLIEDGSAVDRSITRNVDIIFGHGKRICPGEKVAKDQLFIFVSGLCQRYTFLQDPLINYSQKIETQLGATLLPRPHSLIIQKR